ncbi:MAG: hypothetical protein M3220_06790, partial [Chloroflexota bacterium]|nr:hypothetical protein [Chloroflexota bacterium]
MSNSQAHAPPDLVLHGGEVITMADPQEKATAVAVRADRIAAVGSDADMLALASTSTRRIDLDGAVV